MQGQQNVKGNLLSCILLNIQHVKEMTNRCVSIININPMFHKFVMLPSQGNYEIAAIKQKVSELLDDWF
jgi:hypothetical protein